MHEIRITLALHAVPEVARLAHAVGIPRVTVSEAYIHGPDVTQRVLSVETSTPKARAFVEALLSSPAMLGTGYALTSRELRAVWDGAPLSDLTQPMSEPALDVLQDLWQLSHVTGSYVARATGGGILLANGLMENNAVSIVVGALVLPFLSDVLAVSFGLYCRDIRLVLRGVRALVVSTALACASGALVGWLTGGPIVFNGFKGALASFAISAVIGATAGLSHADDTGRRYLIGVAAAVQLAIFPTWFGAALVTGLPPAPVVTQRVIAFLINLNTIAITALAAYAVLRFRCAQLPGP